MAAADTMHGLFLANGTLTLRHDLARPTPAAAETRVRVLRAGVCATDLALARGYMGFEGIPGHEFVGVALDGPLAGRRVVGEINAAPAGFRGDDPRHAPGRTVLGILGRGGAFAEELTLPATNLLAVPDTVSTDAATFTEPLAAAFEIADQVELQAGARGLVVGDGKLGLLCAWVLARHGLRVDVAGRHAARQALLPDGCRHRPVLAAEPDDDERGAYDVAVEASGHPDALPRLVGRVRPRGTIVLKTTTEKPTALDLAPFVVDELTLVGSRCGRFAPALAALAAGEVPVERLVEARYPLARGPEAFAHAARRGVLKVLVDVADA